MRRRARPGGGFQVEARIEKLGGKGDGYARVCGPDGEEILVFVPLSLPGERVLAKVVGQKAGAYQAQLLELLEPAAERGEPPCPYFGHCGGCSLQMLVPEAYQRFKAESLAHLLAKSGLSAKEELRFHFLPAGNRRRASFVSQKMGSKVRLGFFARSSHEVVDIKSCLLLDPGLEPFLEALPALLAELDCAGLLLDWVVTKTESGLDVLMIGAENLSLHDREKLAAFAEQLDLARLSLAATPKAAPEPLAARRAPQVVFSGTPVTVPPGAFLQASLAGEALLVGAALGALPQAAGRRVLDIFAGCGTFSFAFLKAGARVRAVEGDEAAFAACRAAVTASGHTGLMEVERRDLFTKAYTASELLGFDLVVFDPPRVGAKLVAEALAASQVPRVVAVSCNPASFVRDAKILTAGGYQLQSLEVVDQFVWSAHQELVAVFVRS